MKHAQILLTLVLTVVLVGCTISEAQDVQSTTKPSTTGGAAMATTVPTATGTTVPTSLPTLSPSTPAPIAPTETPEPVLAPDPAAARDATIDYLIAQDAGLADLGSLTWSEETATPGGLAGAGTVCYFAQGWTIAVAFPLVAPQATIYHVTLAHAGNQFHWEADVDASGQVRETSPVPGSPLPCTGEAAWQTYANEDYGFAFSYPSAWTLEQDPAELGVPGGRAPHSVLLTRDSLRLLVQYKQVAEEAILGPGGHGAGEIVDLGTTRFFGQETIKKALVYQGKVKSTFLGKAVQDLLFWVQLGPRSGPGLDYEGIDLDKVVQDELDQILATFEKRETTSSWDVTGWLGYVVGNPPGAQYDDALVLLPEGAGRVGIAGAMPELEAEVVALRDKPAPGNQAHLWGTLTCNVPDVNGCQLVVTRLRYGARDTEPEPVEGWKGVLVSNEPGAQFDDYFKLSDRFGAAYGLHSLDADLQAQLEALRDTGTAFRVWGVLRCGVPDAFGSQIEVTRID